MNQKEWIAERLLDIGALLIRETDQLFTWASGIRSPIYCDNRLSLGDVALRDAIATAFLEALSAYAPVDVIAGTATAGIPHAAFLAQKAELPMIYVRSGAKDHGRGHQIEGSLKPGQRVLLIEDLISTGQSVLQAARVLRQAGAEVLAVFSIFHYGFQEAKDQFSKENMPSYSILYYEDILSLASKKGLISAEQKLLLAQFSQNPRIFTP